MLYDLAEKLSAQLELKQVADLIMAEAQRLIPASSGSLRLLDPKHQTLKLASVFGPDPDNHSSPFVGQGIVGDVVRKGQAEIVNDVDSDPRFIPSTVPITAMMCAPLVVQNQVIGVIKITHRDPKHVYMASDLKLLTTLAFQAALSINHCLLHETKLQEEKIRINLEKLLGGRYQILQTLGRGGFARTYIAKDLQHPEAPLCVVKRLRPIGQTSLDRARRLFQNEAELLSRLGQHDQIPKLLGSFEQDGEFYLTLEFIEGISLSQELAEKEKLAEDQAVHLLKEILEILQFVHAHHIVHRDLKPSNLLRRSQDQKLVLIDFGTAKRLQTASVEQERTIEIGTPGYMPIEQVAGYPRFNSDLYAVGMIGIQALTGLNPQQLERDLQTFELIWEASVSSGLTEILNRMVRYSYVERYQTVIEVLHAIEGLQLAASIPSQPELQRTPPRFLS